MNQRTEATKNEYLNSLGFMTAIGMAMKRGEFSREGNFLVYKVGDEERRMSFEDCKKHYETVRSCLGKGVEFEKKGSELMEMLKRLENGT